MNYEKKIKRRGRRRRNERETLLSKVREDNGKGNNSV